MTILSSLIVGLVSFGTPAVQSDRYSNAESSGELNNIAWWGGFRDVRLDALVAKGRRANLDLATTKSRVDEARARVTQSLAPLLPTASWDSSINMAPLDSLGFQFGGSLGNSPGPMDLPELYYTASSTLKAAIEIDLTGRNILKHRTAKIDVESSREDLNQQKVQLTSGIVSAYFDVVTAKSQLRLLQRQLHTNEKLLALTKLRFDSGQNNSVDVLLQTQQLEAARTRIPLAQAQLSGFEQQLAVLLGESPGTKYQTAEVLPALPPDPGVGTPKQLSDQRPDLRAATKRLASATARKKSARRQFAPSLRIQGQYGGQGIHIADWRWQNFWSLGATISVPLSTGGLVWAQAKQSLAVERTASSQFEAMRLQAINEVENALLREQNQTLAMKSYMAQEQAALAALEESRRRYASGMGDYLMVLTTLATYQRVSLEAITAHRDLLAYRIALHTALGDS